MSLDPQRTPQQIITAALLTAVGEGAITGEEMRAAANWLAALISERDAFARDYTAAGKRNEELHERYFALVRERDILQGQVAGLTAVLEWYADEKHYTEEGIVIGRGEGPKYIGAGDPQEAWYEADFGEKARATLAKAAPHEEDGDA
jgi:hypothetical protein